MTNCQPVAYEVWRDAQNRQHFRVKNTTDDMLLQGYHWCPDGRVHMSRYDVVNKKHRLGYCSAEHPLVLALGLVNPALPHSEETSKP